MYNNLKLLICFFLSTCLMLSDGKNTTLTIDLFFKNPRTKVICEDTVIIRAKKNLKILGIKNIKRAYLINSIDTNDQKKYTLISIKERKKNIKGKKITKNTFYTFEITYYTPYQPNVIVIGDRLRYYKIRDKLIYIPNKYIVWEPVVAENLNGLYYIPPEKVKE